MNYRERIRKAIECPQFGNERYGEWGALNLEKRILIKRLLDELDRADNYVKRLYLGNQELKKQLEETNRMIEKLEPVRGSVLTDLTNKDMVLKNNALIELCKTLNNINNKINELIDEVNKLKGEK